jgi:hypothetical protein
MRWQACFQPTCDGKFRVLQVSRGERLRQLSSIDSDRELNCNGSMQLDPRLQRILVASDMLNVRTRYVAK